MLSHTMGTTDATSHPTCAASSRGAGEPLLGTGNDSITRWLLLEVRSPWSPKIPGEVPGMGEAAMARLKELAAPGHVRLQFIRRPQRTGPHTLMWAAGDAGEASVAHRELEGLDELADVTAEQLEAELRPSDPLYFVCTHGRRDACCAREGLPTYQRLREAVNDRVWQTSHLGGHRFAPVVLWLPHNYLLGRLSPDDVERVLACTETGVVPPVEFVRGRNCLTPAEQAAECLLRSEAQESLAHEPWPVVGAAQHEDRVVVRFETDAGVREVAVAKRGPSLSVISSCGDAPVPRQSWIRVEG